MVLSSSFLANKNLFFSEFRSNNIIRIGDFLSDDLLFYVSSLFLSKKFKNGVHVPGEYSDEKILECPITNTKLHRIFNAPSFLDFLSELFEEKITHVMVRLNYQEPATSGIDWHNDIDPGESIPAARCGSIRITLSEEDLDGADFEFKQLKNNEIVRFSEGSLGEAKIFRISPEYQHRVLPFNHGVRKSLVLFVCRHSHKK